LFDNGFRLVLAEVELIQSTWWFTYPGMYVKAVSTKSIALHEMAGTRVQYFKHEKIQGTIMGHTAIVNTPYLYVYWDRIDIKLPMPCALPNVNYLLF
jgi:hypothetical protein